MTTGVQARLRATLAGCAIAATACMPMAAPAAAPAGVRVEQPWIRWLPAGLPQAGYATIVNTGDGGAELTGASSPDYASVTLHQSRLAEGDSTMVPVARIDVPAHGDVKLAPGGYHLMLMHARGGLKPGDHVPITLRFGDGGTLQVDFTVRPASASAP